MFGRDGQLSGGAGLCPSAANGAVALAYWKEGAHGGTMGSPVLEASA